LVVVVVKVRKRREAGVKNEIGIIA